MQIFPRSVPARPYGRTGNRAASDAGIYRGVQAAAVLLLAFLLTWAVGCGATDPRPTSPNSNDNVPQRPNNDNEPPDNDPVDEPPENGNDDPNEGPGDPDGPSGDQPDEPDDNPPPDGNDNPPDGDGDETPDGEDPDGQDPNGDPPDGEDPDGGQPDGPAAVPTGIWRYVSGPVFEDSFDESTVFDVEYLVLTDDGRARVHRRDPQSSLLDCASAVYTQPSENGILIQLDVPELLLFFMPDDATLELTDADSRVSVFARDTAVPEVLQCRELNVVRRVDDLGDVPSFGTGLAFDGVSLWYSDEAANLVERDPVLDVRYPPVDQAGVSNVVTSAQDDDFWMIHPGNGLTIATRRTVTGLFVDDVTMGEIGLAGPFAPSGADFDAGRGVLWVAGNNASDRVILEIDTDAEPDRLLSANEFQLSHAGLSFGGTFLWVVYHNRYLGQVDPVTFQAVATHRLPEGRVFWRDVAFGNGRVYLLGRDRDSDGGVLVEATTVDQDPTPPDPTAPAPDERTGIWHMVEGPILQDALGRTPDVLAIPGDGTASLVYTEADTGTLRCFDGTAVVDGLDLTLQFDGIDGIDAPVVAQIDPSEPHTLALNQAGDVSRLLRRRVLPDRLSCRSFDIVARSELDVLTNNFGGLPFDGVNLWIADQINRNRHPFDPRSGTLGEPISLPGVPFLQAAQDGDFWATGLNLTHVDRFDAAGNVVDRIETDADFNTPTMVRAAAVDETTGELWLHGPKVTGQGRRFLLVNAAQEPDHRRRTGDFDAAIKAMTFDGRHVWAVESDAATILRVDMNEFQTLQTYRSPDPEITLTGIALVDGNIFVLGMDDTGRTSVILELTPAP